MEYARVHLRLFLANFAQERILMAIFDVTLYALRGYEE